jgi:glycyl-tRNA synthetase beta chain
MAELLFEIGTEEIPAGFLTQALRDLPRLADKKLDGARLRHSPARAVGTPRRLTLVVDDLAERQEDLAEDLLGPPAKVAFDKDGKPTKAALAFARKAGVEVEAIRVVTTEKGDYCGARREVAGQGAAALLPELLLGLIREIPFKKSMRWADRDEAFVRPVHWILARFGGAVVPLEFAGVKSGDTTRGHRFEAPDAFAVGGFLDYQTKLRERGVVVDPAERRALVVAEIRRLEAETGVTVVDDPALVDEVTNLVERPTGLCGSFDAKFLEVPREVIIAAMRGHQRYFAMVDGAGQLANRFVTMAGTATRDPALVRRGNERVLAARLSDARFFYAEDQKVKLADRGATLGGMVFVNKLGTQAQRVARLRALAVGLAQVVGAEVDPVARAAELCKADLTTQMVGEFPELQGVMGRDYALRQGEPAEVADAILEHYLPRGASDQLPAGLVGAVLGVADRADAIVGCFGVGLQPTGSADPFALRRAALGILQIVLVRGWRLSLKDLAHNAARGYGQPRFDEAVPAVLEFFRGRLRGIFAETAPTDVVDAVLAAGFEDVVDAAARTRALAALRQQADFEPIGVAFKRVANILKGETVAADAAAELTGPKIEPEEQALADAFAALEKRVAELIAEHAYDRALQDLSTLRPAVDLFFDKVLVMDPDPAIKARRLGLLGRINRLFTSIADFRQLSV